MNIKQQIDDIRDSITPDLHSPDDFIDWDSIAALVERLKPGIQLIDSSMPVSGHTPLSLGDAIYAETSVLEVLKILTAIRGEVRFEDGRYIPDGPQQFASTKETKRIAGVFFDIGVDRILSKKSSIQAQVTTALIAVQADRRRFPTRSRFESRVAMIVERSIEKAQELGVICELLSKTSFPASAKRRAEYVISISGRSAIVISTVFQAQSGGRQQRDLRATYPNLNSELKKDGLSLCLIVDGQGIKEASDNALESLLRGVPNSMTLRQAQSGEKIANLIVDHQEDQKSKRVPSAALATLVESILNEGRRVTTSDLPSSSAQAKLAMAQYVKRNPELNISLTDRGNALTWRRLNEVQKINSLQDSYDTRLALELFADLQDAQSENIESEITAIQITGREGLSLPSRYMAFSTSVQFNERQVKDVARAGFELCPDSAMAFLIIRHDLTPTSLANLRRQQIVLPINVVVLSLSQLEAMAKENVNPIDVLSKIVLEQSDLEKVSPFVVRGVTPTKMFFGRDAEEATLLGTLASSSLAILGGRRIGKTSLIIHVRGQLAEAGFTPHFADCQAIRNWEDFGNLIRRVWNVDVAKEFRPHHLYDLIATLRPNEERKTVILLDEIDHLLDWDMKHTEDEVPESFFRACRGISQQGLAQFVFSGERTIAQKLWDPHSPHWNFCKPLPLRQLERSAASSLILEPLMGMGIDIEDQIELSNEVWTRTSGHPELVQFIGDGLIRKLNTFSRERLIVGPEDVIDVTERLDFSEQYLETYWGQSTTLERIVSIVVSREPMNMKSLASRLKELGLLVRQDAVLQSLRMLELYGVIDRREKEIVLRAEWFRPSLGYYGGEEELLGRYVGELN